MVLLIGGASHTGKTLLAQRLLEKCRYPYLSIDHLKMGLIRSGYTALTPAQDDALTGYLWPVVREMIKTAIENRQNLIVEGCYIPFTYKDDFAEAYLDFIKYVCLIFSESYIRNNYETILACGSVMESRLYADCGMETMIVDNRRNLRACKETGCGYSLIDGEYSLDGALKMLLGDAFSRTDQI
ncbi:MAG: adenylate kinase [Oscillospiraceae bacterium]|nr:adenylate kinase [Oscillospiraceae bacterium]